VALHYNPKRRKLREDRQQQSRVGLQGVQSLRRDLGAVVGKEGVPKLAVEFRNHSFCCPARDRRGAGYILDGARGSPRCGCSLRRLWFRPGRRRRRRIHNGSVVRPVQSDTARTTGAAG